MIADDRTCRAMVANDWRIDNGFWRAVVSYDWRAGDDGSARCTRSIAMIANDRRVAVIANNRRSGADRVNNHRRLAIAFAWIDHGRRFVAVRAVRVVVIVAVVMVVVMLIVVMIVVVMIIVSRRRSGL